MGLTSRERVLMTLQHEEPDRVPMDLGSSRSTGISANAYQNLKAYMGITSETVCFDVKQNLAYPDFELLRRLGVDVVILPRLVPSVGIPIDEMVPGQLPCGGGPCLLSAHYHPVALGGGAMGIYDQEGHLLAKRAATSHFYDECYHPLQDAEDEGDIDRNLKLPSISDEEMVWLRQRAKDIYEHTDFCISAATSSSLFEKGWKDWGMQTFMENLYCEPELVEYYLDKMTDAYIVMMERYLDAVGDYVQIVQNNDDFGSQLNMLLSPELYRKFFKPRHARINEAIRRKKKDIHISLHCCGSIYPIIGDIIESGYDILNPIQKEAANMDPYAIKKNFGDHVTIWGGACSTQTTLTHGSIDEIVAECKEMMKCYAPGGGFVYAAIHNIQADISPEKIMAVFETGRNCGVPSFYRSSSL